MAVLYVSHRLDEILQLCQRVTVFRDGRSVAKLSGPGLTRQTLVEAIVGGAIARVEKAATAVATGDVILSVRGLGRAPRVSDISFDLKKGEVVGFGGLVGAGRSELARLLFGADRPDKGTMILNGRGICPPEPRGGGQGGTGFGAGGTACRGTGPLEKPCLQCRARQSNQDRGQPDAAADQVDADAGRSRSGQSATSPSRRRASRPQSAV